MRRIVQLALAFMLTGCTTMSLEELRRTPPQGTPFQKALAQKYLDFATSEANQYDWLDSMRFADKGLMAAYGKDTAPEDYRQWDIPPHALAMIEKAHAALLAALTPETIAARPELAAQAQFSFDCWVEQQEENWQGGDIARCQDGFAEAMQKLAGTYQEESQEAMEGGEVPAVSMPIPAPYVPAPAAPAQEVIAYVVFFEWNQSVLSAQGERVTQEVIGLLAGDDDYEVVLNGHSDTAESGKGDFSLSERRAEAVKQRLVAGGVDADAIRTFAFGSSDTYIKTGPNVQEPANRRVEIFLND